MWKIIVTIILTSMFFVLFFEPYLRINDDINSKNKVSTTDGFIQDTKNAFIVPVYPTQVMERDVTGNVRNVYGNIGTFVSYSRDDHWISGFPFEPSKS